MDIPIIIPKNNSSYNLTDLILLNFTETVNWDKKCNSCKKKGIQHSKIIKFNLLNEVIILSLQRIDNQFHCKNNSFVQYPNNLDLKEFCDDNLLNLNLEYNLFGIIHHLGDINNGHYFSEIKINENWFLFNDSEVKKLENINLINNTACVLIYNKEYNYLLVNLIKFKLT